MPQRDMPGEDDMSNRALKDPLKLLVNLTTTFNVMPRFTCYPSSWKSARIITAPMKDHHIPESYPVISLPSIIDKVLEIWTNTAS
ncbi:hypothetical protein Trydic_g4659 [Trypoxylus dichotomus]